jgi:6-phosphogluconolactonase (cycloisomerase 2 family)
VSSYFYNLSNFETKEYKLMANFHVRSDIKAMMKILFFIMTAAAACLLAFAVIPSASARYSYPSQGFVYVQTNGVDGNEIVVYRRANDGKLSYQSQVSTGGRGPGGAIDPLQSQSSIVLSDDERFLFSVNAASGTITSFATSRSGLVLVDQEPSGGAFPTSIAVHKDLLYVLNASGNRNITGFRILPRGRLQKIDGSTRGVNSDQFDVGASTIAFSPDGQNIVVSERLANQFNVYKVKPDGLTDDPIVSPSIGQTPFGIYFTPQGTLLVSEAFQANQGAVSSYSINSDGLLNPISRSVPAQGLNTCWVVTTEDGRIAISSNPNSDSLSSFLVSPSGELSYVSTISLGSGLVPLDIAITRNSPYLYTLNSLAGSVSALRVEDNGELKLIDTISKGLKGNSGLEGISAM